MSFAISRGNVPGFRRAPKMQLSALIRALFCLKACRTGALNAPKKNFNRSQKIVKIGDKSTDNGEKPK
jgi:hypothetical protein